jgi:hypothetical protein
MLSRYVRRRQAARIVIAQLLDDPPADHADRNCAARLRSTTTRCRRRKSHENGFLVRSFRYPGRPARSSLHAVGR